MDHRTQPQGDALQDQSFDVVSREVFGYHRRQVDAFMRRARTSWEGDDLRSVDVRRVAFDAVKGGYAADQVDDALDRLEEALARAEREERIRAEGAEAWTQRVQQSVQTLRSRLQRPDGERFRHPSGAQDAGYDVGEVDALCRRLLARLERQDTLASDDVRRAVFSAAVGTGGYDEAQVDAFLDASIDVLSMLD